MKETMKKYGRSLLWLVLIFVMVTPSVHAGGPWLYEEATPDMGVGGAGRQAAAMDASTVSLPMRVIPVPGWS